MPAPWKHDGVRVIPAGSLDTNTAQTPGMDRRAAINFARVGAQKLWAGTVTIHANAKTGGSPSRVIHDCKNFFNPPTLEGRLAKTPCATTRDLSPPHELQDRL